jgi:phenylpyruvate tautomerase PptA (4-oxalocrotonate tautomerase family)
MPLYTAITQEGTVSVETKAKIAVEITRIHTTVMKVPKNSVRVVFFSCPNGAGITGGANLPGKQSAGKSEAKRSRRSSDR